MEVNLSTIDIENAIKKLEKAASDMEKVNQQIVEDMANFAEAEISKNIRMSFYKDGNSDTNAYKEIGRGEAVAGMRGSQALYNEFGTGIIGASSPHPEKNNYALNDYESGPKINASTHTWTYFKDGKFYTTKGIPAGKQVYNAKIRLLEKSKSIIKERLGEITSKL